MNGQILKTLTERTEPHEHLTVSSPGVNWDFRSESPGEYKRSRHQELKR